MASAADADELAAIHGAFADPVKYYGAGLHGHVIAVVEMDVPSDGFMGSGGSLRTKSFEVLRTALPADPENDDYLVTTDGATWHVIEPQRRSDVVAWVLIVEER